MRSLFLRIFVSLWLAMVLVVAVLVVTSPFFTRSRPALEKWHQDAESSARNRVETVSAHIAEEGLDGIPRGRGHGRARGGGPQGSSRVFIFDNEGVELRNQGAPQEVHELAARTLDAGREQSERAGTLYLVARPVADPQGRELVVVSAQHSPPRLVHLLEPRALGWRLAALVVVVGGLSFWLARYLSSPVPPLRLATRRLSGGDLGARVEGGVVQRRDEIGELARDFNAMAERIEVLVGSQQRLLRDVSHELRSPLARLVVALELARSKAGEAATRSLDRIEREAARLDELIGQLLLLERLEAEGNDQAASEFEVGALVDEVVADAVFEAAVDGSDVRFDAKAEGWVTHRRELLRSAFDNVIRNAVHYTKPGSVVEVDLATDDDGVKVTVRDHGPGIGDDELERVFEPFYRVEEARDRSSGGVGLGLAIAARAVRAHGGEISAANHPDGGLVVTVRLPA
jgi:two-component system, OmpR family, sensor histidine kinase CpxA